MNEKYGIMCGGARRWVGVRQWIVCGKTFRKGSTRRVCRPVGRYVARVGLNASKGSGGGENDNEQGEK